MIISYLILLRMRNICDKNFRENQGTLFMSNNVFFRKWWQLWNNVEKYCKSGQVTDDNIIRCMRFACRITKATNADSEYVILIAFLRQQWLHKHAPTLHYAYIACLVCIEFIDAVNISDINYLTVRRCWTIK